MYRVPSIHKYSRRSEEGTGTSGTVVPGRYKLSDVGSKSWIWVLGMLPSSSERVTTEISL